MSRSLAFSCCDVALMLQSRWADSRFDGLLGFALRPSNGLSSRGVRGNQWLGGCAVAVSDESGTPAMDGLDAIANCEKDGVSEY